MINLVYTGKMGCVQLCWFREKLENASEAPRLILLFFLSVTVLGIATCAF